MHWYRISFVLYNSILSILARTSSSKRIRNLHREVNTAQSIDTGWWALSEIRWKCQGWWNQFLQRDGTKGGTHEYTSNTFSFPGLATGLTPHHTSCLSHSLPSTEPSSIANSIRDFSAVSNLKTAADKKFFWSHPKSSQLLAGKGNFCLQHCQISYLSDTQKEHMRQKT